MARRIAYNANMILPPGTKIVTRAAVKAAGSDLEHPEGAVGVITKSPADHVHSYRVRFPDGSEAPLRRTQFAVLKQVQREQIWSAADVLDEFDLMDCVIYRCVVGSRAYGLDESESDTDRRGIYLPPAEMHWSLYGVPEQLENAASEECYWELQKFLTLALKANPNVLECLYTPVVEQATPLARELLEMRGAFLSKMIYQTYNGYVLSQFKKLTARMDGGREIKWKHAMHLIRLLLAGITALREATVPVSVENHRERLLAIRRGELPWPEVDAWRLELHRAFDGAFARTKLPDRPDYVRANEFLIKARARSIGGLTKRTAIRHVYGGASDRYVPAWLIVRINRWPPHSAPIDADGQQLWELVPDITPIRVVWSRERANAEIDRLNGLNATKGCRYVVAGTRVEVAGGDGEKND